MFGMTQERVIGLLRHVMSSIGGLLVLLGLTTTAAVETSTAIVLNAAGPALILAAAGWSFINKGPAAVAAQADAYAQDPDQPIKAVIMENTPEGREIAANLDSPVAVVAGTHDAKALVIAGTESSWRD